MENWRNCAQSGRVDEPSGLGGVGGFVGGGGGLVETDGCGGRARDGQNGQAGALLAVGGRGLLGAVDAPQASATVGESAAAGAVVPGAETYMHELDEAAVQLDGAGPALGRPATAGGRHGGQDSGRGGGLDRWREVSAAPVFVDLTGRRGRRLRRVGVLVGLTCVGYAVLTVATLLSGNSTAPWLPIPAPGEGGPSGTVGVPPLSADAAGPPKFFGSALGADMTTGTGGVPTAPDVRRSPGLPGGLFRWVASRPSGPLAGGVLGAQRGAGALAGGGRAPEGPNPWLVDGDTDGGGPAGGTAPGDATGGTKPGTSAGGEPVVLVQPPLAVRLERPPQTVVQAPARARDVSAEGPGR